ncbi:hypothetical protein [Methylobacillus sp. Pita1]|uniref:hypothetical protein n=1 Tax=Methylobacillus sp. Pita1 TaxID=3382642 RepID=UPI0038B674E5
MVKESNGRWWEFYAVRYAMGSVIGAFIVYLLCLSNQTALGSILFGLENKIDAEKLILLGIYGLAFCYIASAPILVFHATRLFIFDRRSKKKCRERLLIFAISLIFPSWILCSNYANGMILGNSGYYALIGFIISWIIVWQIFLISKAVVNRKRVFEFYKALAIKRAQENTDIIDSYKHLREHGNAFGIVVFEIALGLILYIYADASISKVGVEEEVYKLESIVRYITVILVWIAPASLVWALATSIERIFSGFELRK